MLWKFENQLYLTLLFNDKTHKIFGTIIFTINCFDILSTLGYIYLISLPKVHISFFLRLLSLMSINFLRPIEESILNKVQIRGLEEYAKELREQRSHCRTVSQYITA